MPRAFIVVLAVFFAMTPVRAEDTTAADFWALLGRKTVTADFDDAPLDEAIERVATRAGVTIRFTPDLERHARAIPVTIRAKDASLRRFLDVLSATYGLSWRIERDAVRLDLHPQP